MLTGDHPGKHHAVVVGFAVARTVKRAVARNRVRRLIREAYRHNKEILLREAGRFTTPMELVFLYSGTHTKPDRTPTYRDIEDDMKKLLATVVQMQRK